MKCIVKFVLNLYYSRLYWIHTRYTYTNNTNPSHLCSDETLKTNSIYIDTFLLHNSLITNTYKFINSLNFHSLLLTDA